MRIALLTEGTHSHAQRVEAGWCGRLAESLPEHDFERYVLLPGPVATAAVPGMRTLALGGPCPAGREPGALRGRRYARAYEELVRAPVMPRERGSFGRGLHHLAELAREDGALPAFLGSDHALRVLERVWRSPGADTATGQPLVRDALVAGDLLEQCLRPLSADWYGDGPGRLGGADLCHVVGGGPAALPALVAKRMSGVPFVLTEHGLHLREQYLGYRQAPYLPQPSAGGAPMPVRALLLSFFRLLTEETCRQAAVLTPGSSYDQEWQQRCGAPPERIRVVHEGTPAVADPAAGAEPARPTLVWAGALAPAADPELMLRAFARVRQGVPGARLLMYGSEGPPGYLDHCVAVARRLGMSTAVGPGPAAGSFRPEVGPGRAGGSGEWARGGPAVVFAGRPAELARAWESGSVVVFSARVLRRTGLLADAMLSGRAVVSTEAGVAREVVGPTGLLVPPSDPQALAVACLALLRDEERRARLGLAGRLRAQERFAVEPVAAAFRELYLEVVSRWPAYPDVDRRAGALPRPFARPAEFWVAGGEESGSGRPQAPATGAVVEAADPSVRPGGAAGAMAGRPVAEAMAEAR